MVGFGLGALGVLLGLLLREAGAWWWRVRTHLWRPAAEVAERVAYARACRAGGRILAMGGAVACGLTLIALLAGLSDRAGASVVVGSLTAIGFAIGAWAFTYAHRYHPRPARARPRRGYALVATTPDDLDADALAALPDDATAAPTAPPPDSIPTDDRAPGDRAPEVAPRPDAPANPAPAAPPSEMATSATAAPVPATTTPRDSASPAPAPAPAGQAPERSADEPDSSHAESSGDASSQKPASAETPDAERTPPDANAASPAAEDDTSSHQDRSNRPLASIGKQV
ncbi:MAG: hypothetical protein H0W59_05955 [Chloroflexia bacterium]|nr:hypothetical protein [Chloroflexia bacterium]